MRRLFSILLLCTVALFAVSCSDNNGPDGPGTLTLHFDNVVGDADLKLNTANTPYTNSKGEVYKLTRVAYYVSNIKVKTTDGIVYADGMSADGSAGYYLVDEANEDSQDVTLKNVPEGNYSEVTFTIGVDAGKLDQGTRVGILDPANGLFWNSSSGYIFMSVEGMSPASTEADHLLLYHVGGYKDDPNDAIQANNIKTITLGFNGASATVKNGHEPEAHLLYDVNKFFNGSGASISFSMDANRNTPKSCTDVAENITGAFTVDHVHQN